MAGRGSKMTAQTFLWISFFLMFCGWVITTAGVASLQEACNKGNGIGSNPVEGFPPGTTPQTFQTANAASTRVPFGINGGCTRTLHWYWFIWAFESVAAVGIPLTTVKGALWKGWHTGWIGILAVKAVINMIAANDGLDMTYQQISNLSRTRVFVAGFAISASADLLMIFALGHLGYTHRHDAKEYGGQYATGATARPTVPAAQTV